MNQWKREVWGVRQTPAERCKPAIILFDSYMVHIMAMIVASFHQHYRTKCGTVPGGMTPLLQGIDTHVNRPLKADLKNKYKKFMREECTEFTRGGNKKGPSYQQLVDWCSQAWKDMEPQLLINSFVQTGVTNTGIVDYNNLHSKLKALVEDGEEEGVQGEEEGTGLTDDEEEEDDDNDLGELTL
jgi:hypothetical protein